MNELEQMIYMKAAENKLKEVLGEGDMAKFNKETFRMLQITLIMECEDLEFRKFLNEMIQPTDSELAKWGINYGRIFNEWKEKNNAQ